MTTLASIPFDEIKVGTVVSWRYKGTDFAAEVTTITKAGEAYTNHNYGVSYKAPVDLIIIHYLNNKWPFREYGLFYYDELEGLKVVGKTASSLEPEEDHAGMVQGYDGEWKWL